MTRLRAVVRGQVQGVGFRMATRRRMTELGLAGEAVNESDGTVIVLANGREHDVARLASWLRTGKTPGRVTGMEVSLLDE